MLLLLGWLATLLAAATSELTSCGCWLLLLSSLAVDVGHFCWHYCSALFLIYWVALRSCRHRYWTRLPRLAASGSVGNSWMLLLGLLHWMLPLGLLALPACMLLLGLQCWHWMLLGLLALHACFFWASYAGTAYIYFLASCADTGCFCTFPDFYQGAEVPLATFI